MAKPNIKTLKQSAELFGCELSGGSIKAAIKSLNDYFASNYDENDLSACPACDNAAPDNGPDDKPLTSCPFCGAMFAPVPGEEVPVPKPKAKRNKPNTPKKPKIAKKKKAPEPVEHIATPEQKEELQEHVERIEELRSDVARNTYDIGVELNQINDKALWRGLGHDSFFAYCKADLDFSRASAYKYMLVAREFDREEFGLIGVKKGELIASAPERHKKKLKTAAVKKGKSFTELRSQLDKLEGKQRGAKTSGTEKDKEKPTNEKMSLLGRVKKGEDLELPWIDSSTHEPIEHKDIAGRYVVVALTDEVELVIVPSEDELGVVVNFRKVGEATDVEPEGEEEPEENEEVAEEEEPEENEEETEGEDEEESEDEESEDEEEESEDEEEEETEED